MSPSWRRTTLRSFNHIECKLQRLSISLHLSAPPEPLEEVLKQYMDTLCSAQKLTNFATSLLQDILIFTGHDTTLVEDWLMDIETVADLTSESRTKLSEAKSKSLTCTLITEAITSGKSWDNIKDLLWLEICNSDIHISISHLMEIQQREKESLTAYIYHFKREAKTCNFMNNAATIRLFVKGLKNAHNSTANIYKKGPQTLTDAISEVEKLHATQQLTATLIPSSTVNVMSHEEGHCFQFQESGHIAHHCPNVGSASHHRPSDKHRS